MDFGVREVVDQISSLFPRSRLILSAGFVREEIKTICFEKGKSITASAITNPEDLAYFWVPEARGRLLDRGGRIDLLRQSFKLPELRAGLPLVLEHRNRPRFFETLDRSLQKGRERFVHAAEARVFQERLHERNGHDPKRDEYFSLNQVWERILELRELFDESRLFELAVERIQTRGLPSALRGLQGIHWFHHFVASPRERHFRDELSRCIPVHATHSSGMLARPETIVIERRSTHSLEDGAHHLLDEVLREGLDHSCVVIEDHPALRRTLERVARERGIAFQDARDPTLLSRSEEWKAVTLELELVARQFQRRGVLAWLSARAPLRGDLRRKIIEGNRDRGQDAFSFDPFLKAELEKITERYPARMTLEELARGLGESMKDLGLSPWVSEAVGRMMGQWRESRALLGLDSARFPARHWLKELSDRLRLAPPPVPPVRFASGLRVYRVDQAVTFLRSSEMKIHFFGISSGFFEPREEATEWLGGRDLEVLSSDFSLPDRRVRQESQRMAFLSWCRASVGPVVFWDFVHDELGTEIESAELALHSVPGLQWLPPKVLPVHGRVLSSLRGILKPPRSEVSLELRGGELPIGFLNALGNCPFTAYAQHLLALYDERDPDFEIGNDIYGNLLHRAIELWMDSRGTRSIEEAFDEAWKTARKPGWIRSDRLSRALRAKALKVLSVFQASEQEYQEKSGARVRAQEQDVVLNREGFIFRGRMDRIDQHDDGLVVVDYKTSAKQTAGRNSLEKGKGLQLAAYALALRDQENQEVVSAQYVVLSPERTNRNYGVLFKRWNKGKAADQVSSPLSFVKANHASLFEEEPEGVWRAFDERLTGLLRRAREEGFPARPADPQDCRSCRYSGVCGRGRAVLA